MKKISFREIIDKTSEKLIEINHKIPEEIKEYIEIAYKKEKEIYSKKYLKIILENIEIAEKRKIPICQDTGLAIVFVEMGLDVDIEKGEYKTLDDIINAGIEKGSKEGYLRSSVVSPLERKNTKTNTPCLLYTSDAADE